MKLSNYGQLKKRFFSAGGSNYSFDFEKMQQLVSSVNAIAAPIEALHDASNFAVFLNHLMLGICPSELDDQESEFSALFELVSSVFEETSYSNMVKSGFSGFLPVIPNVPFSDVLTPSEWPIPNSFPGVFSIIGGTGAGKSKWLNKVLRPDIIVRVGEPTEDYDVMPGVVVAPSLGLGFTAALLVAAIGMTVAIDSIRIAAYEIGGAAGDKGIKSSLYTFITSISNIAAWLDVTIPVVINPMMASEAIQLVYTNACSSGVGGALIESEVPTASQVRTFSGRLYSIFDKKGQEGKDGADVLNDTTPRSSVLSHQSWTEGTRLSMHPFDAGASMLQSNAMTLGSAPEIEAEMSTTPRRSSL